MAAKPQDNDTASLAHDAADLQSALASSGDAEVYIEEKKSKISQGTLLLAGLFIVGLGCTYFMYLKAGPKAAIAATAESKAAQATIKEFLTDGKKDLKQMHAGLADMEKLVETFHAFPGQTQVPLNDLKTNPFMFNAPSAEPDSAAEVKRKREEARKIVAAEAAKLTVQSIMISPAGASAIINGQSVKAGDAVDGFQIESIKSGAIVIKQGPFRFQLGLSR